MTEREKFLAAIREAGPDDTPRMAYADWLDENAASDADLARAEFIRLSCTSGVCKENRRKVRVGVTEGRWLDANWVRLLPTLAAASTPRFAGTGGLRLLARRGRHLAARWHYAYRPSAPEQPHQGIRVGLCYWRGFASALTTSTVCGVVRCGGLVRADEPFAHPRAEQRPYSIIQGEDGQTISLLVTAGLMGPVYPLVEGYDEVWTENWHRRGGKVYHAANERSAEDVVEVVEREVARALDRFAAANAGQGYELRYHPDGGWFKATYPLTTGFAPNHLLDITPDLEAPQ